MGRPPIRSPQRLRPQEGPETGQSAGPQRTCIGCRRTAGVAELQRIGRAAEGSMLASRSVAGRGAWICAGSRSCFELAVKRKAFARAFRAPVDRSAVERLRAELFHIGG